MQRDWWHGCVSNIAICDFFSFLSFFFFIYKSFPLVSATFNMECWISTFISVICRLPISVSVGKEFMTCEWPCMALPAVGISSYWMSFYLYLTLCRQSGSIGPEFKPQYCLKKKKIELHFVTSAILSFWQHWKSNSILLWCTHTVYPQLTKLLVLNKV
jgi:hypothetical protein